MFLKKYFLLSLSIFFMACSAPDSVYMQQHDWHGVTYPTGEDAQVYGSYTAGCLDGGVSLPQEGEGFEVINMLNNRLYGHPDLIKTIEKLGKTVSEKYGRKILISDLGHPRGGPPSLETSSHRSHQTGLDVDIWFRNAPTEQDTAEAIYPISVLNKKRNALSQNGWRPYHYGILKEVSLYPEVERILVNPYVKKTMCQKYKGAKWLNKIRPWWGHHKHFHIRLGCPEDSKFCKKQTPVPNHTGCEESLDWWFSKEANSMGKQKSKEERVYPRMPKQCKRVFEWEESSLLGALLN